MKTVLLIILVLAALPALWLLLRTFERHQMYYPTRPLEATPDQAGMEYEDLHLTASDGVRLHGWWVPAEADRGTVLFCHGNAGNISHRLDSVAVFHRLGLNVLIFDYRGFGHSEGTPDEEGTYRDAEAAYRYLREERGIGPDRIVIFGRSLGGAVAIELAGRVEAAGLIGESTFTSTVEMGKLIYPFLPIRLMVRNRYDSLSKVGNLKLPALFIHSPDDELVPFDHGRRLYLAAAAPKEFLSLRGGHGDGFLVTGPAYPEGIDSFLRNIGL